MSCRWCECDKPLNPHGFCDDKCERLAVWMEWTIDDKPEDQPAEEEMNMPGNKQFDNSNHGVLFRARDKKSDKSPDYTGSAEVDGVEYRMSAWVKESKQGLKFFSISFTPKDEARQPADNIPL